MGLVPITSGHIFFEGVDIARLSRRKMRMFRKQVQMVFQDPGGSLNEYMRVGDIVSEPLLVHGISKGKKRNELACELLELVGLDSRDAKRFPHEFSGGQKQRIAIARTISMRPKLLVCDEPTSALDVTVQAKILNLLGNLRENFGLTLVFISHDLAVVHHFCDEVIVMSNGTIVEFGTVEQVIQSPQHDVTKELVASSQEWNLSDSPSIIE
jgi:ABC-type microcin C transport system duplicated ATPase subunit YejF